jgi:hypothetical protein
MTINQRNLIEWGFLGFVFVLPLLVIIYSTNFVDLTAENIAFDWRWYYTSLQGDFDINSRLFVAVPWSVPILLPFTWLPFHISWALALYLTLIALIVAVPRTGKYKGLVMGMLLIAYPTVRNFADLNLEQFMILGVLLILYAFKKKQPYLMAFGLLLAAFKPQETLLLFFLLAWYILKHFSWTDILKIGFVTGGIFLITMFLYGAAWWANVQAGPSGLTIVGMGKDWNLPLILVLFVQFVVSIVSLRFALLGDIHLSQLKAGLLIAASLIVSPYANGLSLVTLLAIGVTVIAVRSLRLGSLLFLLYSLIYLQFFGLDIFASGRFPTLSLFLVNVLTWAILLYFVYRDSQFSTFSATIIQTESSKQEK